MQKIPGQCQAQQLVSNEKEKELRLPNRAHPKKYLKRALLNKNNKIKTKYSINNRNNKNKILH
jgi:hypothetical protein